MKKITKKNIWIILSVVVILGLVLVYFTVRSSKASNFLCEDDDNGKNSKKRAVVKFVNDEKIINRMDQCYSNILVEYYCDKGGIESENVNCAAQGLRCYAGACIK